MRFQCHRKILVFLVLLSTAAPGVASLRVLEPVTLEPGDLLEQVIEWDKPRGERIQIRLDSAPQGAQLVLTREGELLLRWQTGPDMPDETPLTVQATNIDTQAFINTQTLKVLRRQESEPQVDKTQTPPAITAPISLPTVTLAPLAGRIVSAGRNVSMRFNATSSDGEVAVLSMDRLPRNATLEKNSFGVYSFFWQTSDRDQGEHVFRVTATHPTQPSISSSREITVVVGDPTRGRTVP